jgi:hypothetical protein
MLHKKSFRVHAQQGQFITDLSNPASVAISGVEEIASLRS